MNVLLVHGAWHSSWVWDLCLPTLKTFCNPIALDMPGRVPSKERSYLKITLHDYVKTVIEKIESMNEPCYLLGHSMAGMVISQVAETIPEKLLGLVYLAAYIPIHGESLFDLAQQAPNKKLNTELQYVPKQNQILIAPSNKTQESFYQRCPSSNTSMALERLQPEPLKPFTTKVSLTDQNFGRVKKMVIHTQHDNAISLKQQKAMAKRHKWQQMTTLESDHSPFLSSPLQLCEAIQKLCAL